MSGAGVHIPYNNSGSRALIHARATAAVAVCGSGELFRRIDVLIEPMIAPELRLYEAPAETKVAVMCRDASVQLPRSTKQNI